jgi:HNH endonuclease
MNPLYELLYTRDGHACRHCKSRCDLHPHHVIYRSHQGPDELTNLITLCAICHQGHHDGKLKIDLIKIENSNPVVHFTRLLGWKPQ